MPFSLCCEGWCARANPTCVCVPCPVQNARLRAAEAAANAAQQTAVASVTSLLQERDRLLRENGDLRQEMARLQVAPQAFLPPSLFDRPGHTLRALEQHGRQLQVGKASQNACRGVLYT